MPFFVSGLFKFMGKLADRIFFLCPGPTGVGFGVPFFASGLYKFMGKLADRIFLVSRAHGGWVWGLYKFMGKLAHRIFFGVQGPRGLGLGCRSLCLAFKSLWEN